MKKLFIVLSLALTCLNASAWDLIITRESGKIECRVEEVSETLIKYRKSSNPQGPLFTIAVKDVATVIYEDGEVQAYEEQPEPQQVQQQMQQPQNRYNNQPMSYEAYQLQRMQEREQLEKAREEAKEQRKQAKEEKKRLHNEKMSQKKVYFQGMFEWEGVVGYKAYRSNKDAYSTLHPNSMPLGPSMNMILGFRTQNLINFFGFGLGANFYFDISTGGINGKYSYYGPKQDLDHWQSERYESMGLKFDGNKVDSLKSGDIGIGMIVPVFVNDRVYLPTAKNVNPFIDLSLGGYLLFGGSYSRIEVNGNGCDIKNDLYHFGVFSRMGIGMEYKRFVLGAGYQMLVDPRGEVNNFYYLKIGVRMGWLSPAKPIIKH